MGRSSKPVQDAPAARKIADRVALRIDNLLERCKRVSARLDRAMEGKQIDTLDVKENPETYGRILQALQDIPDVEKTLTEFRHSQILSVLCDPVIDDQIEWPNALFYSKPSVVPAPASPEAEKRTLRDFSFISLQPSQAQACSQAGKKSIRRSLRETLRFLPSMAESRS